MASLKRREAARPRDADGDPHNERFGRWLDKKNRATAPSEQPVRCVAGITVCGAAAIAFLFPSFDALSVESLLSADGGMDLEALDRRLRQMAPDAVFVEGFDLAGDEAFGDVLGILADLGIRCSTVTSCRWRKHFGLLNDPAEARTLALRMWPERGALFGGPEIGLAEAALLARAASDWRSH